MDKYVILFLGNPGTQYERTRHNVGFRAGDSFCDSHQFEPKQAQCKSVLYSGVYDGVQCLVAFPTTYMNESGRAARALLDYYQVPLDRFIVVYDDFDIPFGKIRVRGHGSAGTHNGMKSIVQHLGSTGFPRCRIGIGPRSERQTIHDFVLSPFSQSEEKQLGDIFILTNQILDTWLSYGIEKAMASPNALEGKPISPNKP